ncbi:TPA: hypothetical protein NHT78_000427 [Morganella morganii]|uniref:Uncharacterized protein n=1 Tax=Morganella morganii TaxID=582 RepID=A0AAI9HVU3_MORMO|nr:hypothetical protein [Morganella morganii]HCE8947389.1 hypothetical protein [Morganella morganii]
MSKRKAKQYSYLRC